MEFTLASPRLLSDAFNTWPDCLLGASPHAGLLGSGMKGKESSYQEKSQRRKGGVPEEVSLYPFSLPPTSFYGGPFLFPWDRSLLYLA